MTWVNDHEVMQYFANRQQQDITEQEERRYLETLLASRNDRAWSIFAGDEYAGQFHALYRELAQKYRLPLVDFFLDGVALDDTLMQADGIHPNAKAQPRLLDNLWPALSSVLTRTTGKQ